MFGFEVQTKNEAVHATSNLAFRLPKMTDPTLFYMTLHPVSGLHIVWLGNAQ